MFVSVTQTCVCELSESIGRDLILPVLRHKYIKYPQLSSNKDCLEGFGACPFLKTPATPLNASNSLHAGPVASISWRHETDAFR